MTYLTLLKRLSELGADAPAHEALEMARVLAGRTREWCMCNRETELPECIDSAVAKRECGVPLQYILGEAWFYGNRFTVSPDCLIPQPDTEHCVAIALDHLHDGGRLLDLCTGSGCIAISVLKEAAVVAAAIDISPAALAIAQNNAISHGVADRLRLIESDVLSTDILPHIADADVIVSNPPYIDSDVIDTLSDEVRHEPRIALDGGSDGMLFYRRFIRELAHVMKRDAVMILEIGYDQSERILDLCSKEHLNCRLHRDFGGNVRVAEITRNNSEKKNRILLH